MLSTIETIVRKAAGIIKTPDADKGITSKSCGRDLVTLYDKKIQELLYSEFSRDFPDAGFLGEEQLNKPSRDGGVFIIDPIDGTTNFIKGLNHSGISVGYCRNGIMTCGVVYDPYADEMFTAELGKGAYLNGRPIHISDEPIERSVCHYGTAPYYDDLRKKSFDLAAAVTALVIDSRRRGAASLDFCDVACGRAELYFEYYLSPWDLAAGSLIASEAGAIVTDMDGKPLQYEKGTAVAVGTPKTYPILMDLIKKQK